MINPLGLVAAWCFALNFVRGAHMIDFDVLGDIVSAFIVRARLIEGRKPLDIPRQSAKQLNIMKMNITAANEPRRRRLCKSLCFKGFIGTSNRSPGLFGSPDGACWAR